ncbi:hypothetical protein CXG81DRAFT_27171 [Caulochytrium protostelioides]|uniref:Glutamine-dependent NAD(+) synthetase n=1 Tax=Caulochytrium protostelioides TaxID=1555241 RepID=A0A4P9WWS8_9FUNG|nr:glutamine-dependent NAD synthetase with GAT domain-containing protein [Caulochytrium protostelioides]RKP00099.1 hypothetical protein CXG81DRAFT_27171 [Caulochytrium protostelioides]|eukprot:RKP00099.1 hypothetical protein CXG81DRAFT_27171 [Caulochytrium protostelioides]
MSSFVTVATCSLNQWALDFEGNFNRIVESVRRAKAAGARFRLGPELEITGYGCNDHFYENDTYTHSWEVLAQLLQHPECRDILIDVGMPVRYRNTHYNCRVIFLNSKIVLIRPKLYLANDGNYREMRWFTPWSHPKTLVDYTLPTMIATVTGQKTVPFGDGVVATLDTVLGTELCEELFTPDSPHIHMSLDGVEIFTNSSSSHHEFQKLGTRIQLMREATLKCGGAYLYANQQGCDGERVYYDGGALVALNGDVVAQGSQFSMREVEVTTACIDLEQIRGKRGGIPSRGMQSAREAPYPRVSVNFSLMRTLSEALNAVPPYSATPVREVFYHTPEEEIQLGPACWLWDYLRRSRQAGFFLPLSGGLDSCSTALIVASMCKLVVQEIKTVDAEAERQQLIRDARRVAGLDPVHSDYVPTDARELCGRLLHTCYMGSANSGPVTRERAKKLADAIGAYHFDLNIQGVVDSVLTVFQTVTSKALRYKTAGGAVVENLALQNIQARSRMVLSYLFAGLLPWHRSGGVRGTSLLVLGSSNVDETLRGYFTKYDCSSADLNPIGGIAKLDLRRFIAHMARTEPHLTDILQAFLDAAPTAELEPETSAYVQTDEADMGMSYAELGVFGSLRKVGRCGPLSMFKALLFQWRDRVLSPTEIAAKVRRFWLYYGINRHKTTILPPSYHMSPYSPDDNRYDLRPFLYNSSWSWQFRKIDETVQELAAAQASTTQTDKVNAPGPTPST